MACVAVFLCILFTASKATLVSSYSCSLDTKFSASGNGVDMTDLSEAATSLQYCIIDNCIIMRSDTGEELEIIHTTESLIIAVPTSGHTSEIVLMLGNEIRCLNTEHNTNVWVTVGVQLAVSLVHTFINIYVVAVHLLSAKELSVFSKLLMSHNNYCIVLGASNLSYHTFCSSTRFPGGMSKYPLLFHAINNGF